MLKVRVNEQHLIFQGFHERLNLSDGATPSLIDFSGHEVEDQRVAVVGAGRGKPVDSGFLRILSTVGAVPEKWMPWNYSVGK